MVRLLVSVRDATEAISAIQGGADIVDVKEPNRGPLGRPEASAVEQVLRAVAGRRQVTAALGELIETSQTAGHELPAGLAMVKLGLARCGTHLDWPQRWAAALAGLPASCQRVAVAYADWRSAGAPSPGEVLERTDSTCARALLVDTFDKTEGDLFRWLDPRALSVLVRRAKLEGLMVAVAGSLSSGTIPVACHAGADVVAVRGAACVGGRLGSVDAGQVRGLRSLLDEHNSH